MLRAKACGAKVDDQLDGPELPQELSYVWDRFLHLSNRRGSNGFGVDKIKDIDLLCWSILHQTFFEEWELDAIYRLDDVFISVFSSDKDEPDV